jgi:branched-chain amino acid aminotransferase
MLVPVDDHLVHRGDGVFEAFRCVDGSLYNMGAHLERLARSAAGLRLAMPGRSEELVHIVVETVRAGGQRNSTVRLYLSRGPGSFGPSPADSPEPQLYVIATQTKPVFMLAHPDGATAASSTVPPKLPEYATVKNCNYLPNVLMTREAGEAGVDFCVGFDAQGILTECATANMGIVGQDGRLLFPKLDAILAGTTMLRVMDLAQEMVAGGALSGVDFADISRESVAAAREVLITGTTVDVVAVRAFDGQPVGEGKPGPVFRGLRDLLERDMRHNAAVLTPVF